MRRLHIDMHQPIGIVVCQKMQMKFHHFAKEKKIYILLSTTENLQTFILDIKSETQYIHLIFNPKKK